MYKIEAFGGVNHNKKHMLTSGTLVGMFLTSIFLLKNFYIQGKLKI